MGLHGFVRNNRNLLIVQRILDGIPGFIVLLVVIGITLGALFAPEIIVPMAAMLAFYSSARFCLAAHAYVYGLKFIRQAENTDWRARYSTHHNALMWEAVQHIVIIPNYNEPLAVLRKSLENIAQSPEAAQITIVLAMEAAEPGSIEKARALQMQFKGRFAHIAYTVHPAGLPGEIRCKSANQAWAARHIRNELIEQRGMNIDHVVITTMDSDTLWHKDYFTALTYHFAVDPNRHHRFWQAPIRYHGNIHHIDPMLRLSAVYPNAMELAYLAAPWWSSLPISSYSLSLRLLDDCDYWDADVIADEWHMYIKAFFQRRAELELVPIYLPFLATMVTGETLWHSFRNRYAQIVRHAWGSKEIGYTISKMRPEVDMWRSLRLLLSVSHDLIISGAGWLFLTLGSQLPLLLHDEIREYFFFVGWRMFPYVLFQVAFMMVLVVTVLVLFLDIRTRPPRPADAIRSPIRTFIGFLLLPVFMVGFVVAPLLHAQMRLLAGNGLAFEVTAKDISPTR